MNSIRKIDKIILTYYVNPHHFYFKYKEDAQGEKKLEEINEVIEAYVSRHIEKRHSKNYSPQIGEIVLCHYISDCIYKWIRARVDLKLQYDKELFILWAIDYGFPIETDSCLIRPIEEDELKVVYEGLIFKGGLFEIVPSTVEYNFIQSAEESRKTKKWSSRAVGTVEKYLHQTDDLTFKCRAYFEDHFFGSLIIQSQLVVEEFLKSTKEGVDSDNFLKEFSRLEDQPYWQRQQEDAIYKIYENNSDIYGSDDVTTSWMSHDDLLSKCEDQNDLPKLLEINSSNDQNVAATDEIKNPTADTTTDDALIKLSHQLSDARLSHSGLNSTNSYRTSRTSTIMDKIAQQKVTDTMDTATINKTSMRNRLVVAQQKLKDQGKITAQKTARIADTEKKVMKLMFPAGFIVDNKAIEDKYKEHHKNNTMGGEKIKNKSRFDKAKETEGRFSVDRADRILVHNHGNIPYARINDIHDAEFPREIHHALKELNIQQIFRIQTVGWPCLMRGVSMIFVNNVLTGKTWTLLPAVCGLIIKTNIEQRIQDKAVVGGCGPLAIITCASTQEVNETTKRIGQLLRFAPGIRCFKAFGFRDQPNVVCNLLNGAEILVTTVPCLHRLMVNELNLFTKERIISLVFDNIDLAYERFGRQIHEIYKALCAPTSNVQAIITSRTWHKVLANFYEESSRFTLCIGSYIEAAVYGRTKMTIEMLGNKFKIDKLISHLNDIDYRFELTIVICNTSAEVGELVQALKSMAIEIWYYHDESDSLEIGAIKKQILNCEPGLFKLFICTDEVLRDLDIRCAIHIVHFSLPATWTTFGFRFSTLFNHHQNLLERKSDQEITTSVVFLDENNNNELPRLVDFMQIRGNSNIPAHVLRLAESIRIENASNIYQPFCNDLATIGTCYGQFTCRYRHILTKFDGSRNEIPQNGFVKFDIIDIRSPVHFTVRLLEHKPSRDGTWTRLNSAADFLSFNMKMMKYFENDKHRLIHHPIALGDLCAVCIESDGVDLYQRGKIIKIEEKKCLTVTTQYWVEILLIDCNDRMSCFSSSLMVLPDEFKNFPHHVVDVRIADIVPRDFDNEWDSSILELVKKWIGNGSYQYSQGFVKLSIMNTIWVDSVDLTEVLQSINEEVKTASIKKNLLSRNFCVRDSKPLELLKSLAKNADLIRDTVFLATPTEIVDCRVPNEVSVFNKSDDDNYDIDGSNPSLLNWSTTTGDDDEDVAVPFRKNLTDSLVSPDAYDEDLQRSSADEWAELPSQQFHKVFLGIFYHPNRIYIRNSCHSARFVELTHRIATFAEFPENLIPMSNVALAKNCLAKIGSAYCRAKIMKLFHQADAITAEVFYVDFGEFLILPIEELAEIPEKFVTALPFQAIFCSLIGIRPTDSPEWCDDICDTIYDELMAKQSHLYARSVQLGGPDRYAYGLKSQSYQVVLFDEMGHININNWIVESHYGEWDPDTKDLADIAPPLLLNSESSDESDYKESDGESFIDDCNDDDHFDIQFDDDDILTMLRANGIPFTKRTEPLPAEIEEIRDNERTNVAVAGKPDEKTNSSVEKLSPSAPDKIDTGFVELLSLYKIPKIKWHQTESIVVVAIHAPDTNDYCLTVTSRILKICFVQQPEKYSTILNLFGCIEAKYTIHCVRGLYIVVRLVKTLNKLSWPRLVQQQEKDHFIGYNFEADKCHDTQTVSEKASADFHQQNELYYSSSDEDQADEADSDAELLYTT